MQTDNLHTLVIGGGQSGLAAGYHLAKRGVSFLIVDGHPRIGDAWRNRWDSLRLFTPARYAGLPGFPFPAKGDAFPTKEEVAEYLEAYANRFQLPVLTGVRVERLWKNDGAFVATAGGQRFSAENVIIAMANYQKPRIPAFARELSSDVRQLHSLDYRNPGQLQGGPALVVGAGNSAADIAVELARTRKIWMAGQESGHIPFPIESFFARHIAVRIVRFLGHHVLSVRTPIGRKLRPKLLRRAAPLVRVRPQDLTAAGIERVPRVTGVREGQPLLADGRTLAVSNVIWCTGFHPAFDWIDLPAFNNEHEPLHERGVADGVPGLYFVGLHFLYSMSSATLMGVGRDAERIVKTLVARSRPVPNRAAVSVA